MLRKSTRQRLFNWLVCVSLLALGFAAQPTRAQTAANRTSEQPLFNEYKGIKIGMTADQVRAKLGEPSDKSDGQDFYLFSEKESAQIFYDKAHQVMALAVNYVGDGSGAPECKAVLGSEAEVKGDGAMYKLVRYPKAGYWVSYSRAAGPAPVVTITIQKMNS